ncbi:MAG: ATP-binding protein [Syntrophomonadaceae bacterium]
MGNSSIREQIKNVFSGGLGTGHLGEVGSRPVIAVLLLIALVTGAGKLWGDDMGLTNILMLYMLPVIFASVRMGVKPSIFIALVSVLCWDVFFVPPVLNLTVSDPRQLITLLVFMLVAYATGSMSDRLRDRIREAVQRENRTRILYETARGLAAVTEMNVLAQQVVSQTAAALDAEAALFMPGSGGRLKAVAANKSLTDLASSPNDLLAAQWAFDHRQPSGLSTDLFPGARGYHVPVQTEDKVLGVLSVKPANHWLEPERINLLQALAGLSALAVLRLELAEEAQEIKSLEASEKLRAALFNSISHDLKTPLTSILASVSSLVDDDTIYDQQQKATLLKGIKQGAERMYRFISNLLDMARLESGYLKLNADWYDIQDIVGVTLRENQEILEEHSIQVDIPDDTPLIKVDYALAEQVLTNLLHNAVKYSPPHTAIRISVTHTEGALMVAVVDQGEGIPPGDEELIFDKFYRLQSPRNVSGTGLGLSICRGIIEAHGGRIWAVNRSEGGSQFNFILPIAPEAPLP